ncbi:unnamed protein product [Bursaphelenchus xylophilus]|uniref:(pine wood nematode) hypothetical protein n=1 Tax=Bursaphelenchus xylophilus TaxID=6326 RepID=A0A1I7S9A4_BURXY|nr:unnamed protein product [Bursaphelenchus xylophilus]CAG9100477.1 unnamed protein product [Bursaphelenchus xylophilus]
MERDKFLQIGYYLASCSMIMDMFTENQIKPNAYEIVTYEWSNLVSAMYKSKFIFRGPDHEDTLFDKVRVQADFGADGIPTYLRVFEDNNGQQFMQLSYQGRRGKDCVKFLNSSHTLCYNSGTSYMTSKDNFMFVPSDVTALLEFGDVSQPLSLNEVYRGITTAHEVRVGVEVVGQNIYFYRDDGDRKECKQLSYALGSLKKYRLQECKLPHTIDIVEGKSTMVSLAFLKAIEYMDAAKQDDKCVLPITQASILQNTYVRFLYKDPQKEQGPTDDMTIYIIAGVAAAIFVVISIIGIIVCIIIYRKKQKAKFPALPPDEEFEAYVAKMQGNQEDKSVSKTEEKSNIKSMVEKDNNKGKAQEKDKKKSTSEYKQADANQNDFGEVSVEVEEKEKKESNTKKKDIEKPTEILSKQTPKKSKESKKLSKKKAKKTPPGINGESVVDKKNRDRIESETSFTSVSDTFANKKKPSTGKPEKRPSAKPMKSEKYEDGHDTVLHVGARTEVKKGKGKPSPLKDYDRGRENFKRLMKEVERADQSDKNDESINSEDKSRA